MVISGHHSGIKVWGGRRGIVLLVRANVKPDSLQKAKRGRTEATYCVLSHFEDCELMLTKRKRIIILKKVARFPCHW